MKKKCKLKFNKIFIIFLTISIILPFYQVYAKQTKTIRVGYYANEGYHTIDNANKHSGYDFEYLSDISSYTGWNYEFIEGSWAECISMLENGEIDLLGGVEKNEKRLHKMIFSNQPSIYATNYLLVEPDCTKYAYQNYKGFDGMTIGVLKGSTLIDSLYRYSQENHFSFHLKEYNTETELKHALKNNKIDSIYLTDIRPLDQYKVIGNFGYSPMYYALSPKRSDLEDELNNALQSIHNQNHYYESELHNKYFSSPNRIAFTVDEREYIRTHNKVDVILFDDFPMICQYDHSTQQYSGMIMEVLNQLSEKTHFQFHFIEMDDDQKWEYMINHPNTLIAPTLDNELVEFNNQIQILDPIIHGRMVAITKQNKTIDLSHEFKIAISDTMLGAKENLLKKYPHADIITENSHTKRLSMVNNGDVDMTLINEFTGNHLLQSPYYSNLKIINSEFYSENISLSLSINSNSELISILNKAIASFNERDIRQIIINNTMTHHYELSFGEWVYKNFGNIILVMIIIIGCIIYLYKSFKLKQKDKEEKQKLKVAEEKHQMDIKYQQEIFYQAHYDALTHLYNKNYFIEKANKLLQDHPDVVYAFFRLNVEKFKMINEMYGQEKGDIVLKKIAEVLRTSIGDNGVYGRIYSDHFAICYPVHEKDLLSIPELSSDYIDCDGQKIRVQINVGIYINDQHYTDATQLLDYAQIALQNRKKSQIQHISFFKDAYLQNLIRNQEITNEMDKALKDHQFKVFLQPQYEIISNKLVGAEALVRWIHPQKGLINPNEFIPVFEGNHFIYKLDSFVFETVCEQLAKWRSIGKMIPISVNLSRIDLQNPYLIPMLKANLDKYQIPAKYLHLEITESVYMDNHQQIIQTITDIQKLGFLVEMDDFGSGYSSLNMLKDIPVDILKLDLRFFSDETHMDKGGNIIGAVVNLAHTLGMLVIAEGVETQREANFLRSIHCHFVQGFLYNRPMPISDFEKMLQDSAIGEKVLKLDKQQEFNLYWRSEKFNNLLRENKALLFDYDPVSDYAIFTFLNSNGELSEKAIHLYSQKIYKNTTLHPDDRLNIQEILDGHNEIDQLEFQADFLKTGTYQWYIASFYYYYRKDKLNRIIAIIKAKE